MVGDWGTITSSGIFVAPALSGSVVVTAAGIQDTSKTGNLAITVHEPAATTSAIAVACSPATIAPDTTSQCSAAVQGTGSYDSTVTWTATGGTIDTSRLFTAPPSTGSVTVRATSKQDSTVTGTAILTIGMLTPASKHIVLVMEENQSYESVVGNTQAWPHLNDLIADGAIPTNYYADAHFSIPNYFMLTTGQILTKDDNTTQRFDVDSIARRLLAAGVPFKIYAVGAKQGYSGGNTGLSVKRHNPFAYLSDIANNPQVARATIWPFSQFAVDVANHALPELSFVVPDLVDDAHDNGPPQADDWLQSNIVAPLTGYSAFQPGGDGLLIVNFDESVVADRVHGGGHIAPALWGPTVLAGFKQTSATVFQHESMLRMVMEALGLPNPPGAAATAPSMAEFFVQK